MITTCCCCCYRFSAKELFSVWRFVGARALILSHQSISTKKNLLPGSYHTSKCSCRKQCLQITVSSCSCSRCIYRGTDDSRMPSCLLSLPPDLSLFVCPRSARGLVCSTLVINATEVGRISPRKRGVCIESTRECAVELLKHSPPPPPPPLSLFLPGIQPGVMFGEIWS